MFHTSFSIGVSAYNTEHELNNTLELADKNMYIDKASIKQRITGIAV